MFEIGDKVVCIKNKGREFTDILNGKIYNVRNLSLSGNQISLIEIPNRTFYNWRFISLTKYRKQKIEKLKGICSKMETK
jgi:hypothetical protein